MSNIIQAAKPGDTVFVSAHGNIKEDFTGTVTRVDTDNYLIFVRKHGRKAWGCFAAHVAFAL